MPVDAIDKFGAKEEGDDDNGLKRSDRTCLTDLVGVRGVQLKS